MLREKKETIIIKLLNLPRTFTHVCVSHTRLHLVFITILWGKYKDVIKVENIKNYLFKNINMVLLIKSIRTIKDKKGGEMAFLECEDETGKVNLTMFSS